MLRQIFQGYQPDRTYGTAEKAIAAFTKTCTKIGVEDMAYTVQATVIDGAVRWYVMVFPRECQIQDALCFGHHGIRSVRV